MQILICLLAIAVGGLIGWKLGIKYTFKGLENSLIENQKLLKQFKKAQERGATILMKQNPPEDRKIITLGDL